jgi:hypothetical protein
MWASRRSRGHLVAIGTRAYASAEAEFPSKARGVAVINTEEQARYLAPSLRRLVLDQSEASEGPVEAWWFRDARELWTLLEPSIEDSPRAKQAAIDLARDSTDEHAILMFAGELERLFNEDSDLALEVEQVWRRMPHVGKIVNVEGSDDVSVYLPDEPVAAESAEEPDPFWADAPGEPDEPYEPPERPA